MSDPKIPMLFEWAWGIPALERVTRTVPGLT
jgi:hypothetical protein